MPSHFKWRHQYDDAADEHVRQATSIHNNDPALTQQHYQDEVDINVMMKRMGITDDTIPVTAIDPKRFGDFTGAVDFREALDRMREAQLAFSELPAKLRSKFQNDPANLMEYVVDPKNHDEAVELGILKREKVPAAPEKTAAEMPPTV